MTKGRAAAGLASAAALCLSACTSTHASSASDGSVAQPLRVPYVVMTDARTGVAVVPSGSQWLVLSTTDGFAHVANRTPIGVSSEGGVALAANGNERIAAIGTHERLLRSPVLVAHGSWQWQPQELPGAVAQARGSVASSAGTTVAVLAGSGGTVVARSASSWRRLTTGRALAGRDADFQADATAWTARSGVVTGHGGSGVPTAYRTSDGGAHWSAVPATSGRAVAALQACPESVGFAVPVVDSSGTLRVVDDAGHAGASVDVGTGPVAFGCAGREVLVIDGDGHLRASTDEGATWRDDGAAPRGVTALAPTGSGTGYAASIGGTTSLWRIDSVGRFTRIRLPGWVATLGGRVGSD